VVQQVVARQEVVMRTRLLLVLLVVGLLGLVAALNWDAITAPAKLNLLLVRVEAPLGLGLLAAMAVLAALLETAALVEVRGYAREILALRQLAESAETSRYAELRRHLDAELAALRAAPGEAARGLDARLAEVETRLKEEIERVGNTLAAYIGELEDRLTRGSPS
jgi:uncharacterized integral membrane protein